MKKFILVYVLIVILLATVSMLAADPVEGVVETDKTNILGGVKVFDIITIVLTGLALIAGGLLGKILGFFRQLEVVLAKWNSILEDRKITEDEWSDFMTEVLALFAVFKKKKG